MFFPRQNEDSRKTKNLGLHLLICNIFKQPEQKYNTDIIEANFCLY